jgi:hypothetical protein
MDPSAGALLQQRLHGGETAGHQTVSSHALKGLELRCLVGQREGALVVWRNHGQLAHGERLRRG